MRRTLNGIISGVARMFSICCLPMQFLNVNFDRFCLWICKTGRQHQPNSNVKRTEKPKKIAPPIITRISQSYQWFKVKLRDSPKMMMISRYRCVRKHVSFAFTRRPTDDEKPQLWNVSAEKYIVRFASMKIFRAW